WLTIQKIKSVLPRPGDLLVETFPRGSRHYLVCYPFEGRLAHQTLGMLLTRRLERLGARPLGFVASDYALAVWGLRDLSLMVGGGRLSLGRLFDQDMLGDDLEAWLTRSEEHTSELQSRENLVCPLLPENNNRGAGPVR